MFLDWVGYVLLLYSINANQKGCKIISSNFLGLGALIGAYLPLILALIIYHPLEAGNPFFSISMLASILGFYLPVWIESK